MAKAKKINYLFLVKETQILDPNFDGFLAPFRSSRLLDIIKCIHGISLSHLPFICYVR